MNYTKARPDKLFLIASFIFLAMFILARLILKEIDVPAVAKISLTVLAVLSFIYFLFRYFRRIRTLDELERQIQLEALAIAFPLTMILLMTLGLFELFVPLPIEDLSYRHVWAFLPIFYFIGLSIARKKYA